MGVLLRLTVRWPVVQFVQHWRLSRHGDKQCWKVPGKLRWVIHSPKEGKATNLHPCATDTLSGTHMALNTQYLELLVIILFVKYVMKRLYIYFFGSKKLTHLIYNLNLHPPPYLPKNILTLIIPLIIYSVHFFTLLLALPLGHSFSSGSDFALFPQFCQCLEKSVQCTREHTPLPATNTTLTKNFLAKKYQWDPDWQPLI